MSLRRMPDDIDEIIFVNGGSVDRTAEVARQLWPDGLHINQTRGGIGNALACGIEAASGQRLLDVVDVDDAVLNGASYQRCLGRRGTSDRGVLCPNPLKVRADGRGSDLQLVGDDVLAFGPKPRDQHFFFSWGKVRPADRAVVDHR